MQTKLFIICSVLIVSFLSACSSRDAEHPSLASLGDLRVEYTSRPVGIDVAVPRFSWRLIAPAGTRGYCQAAYGIEVTGPGGQIMWDTGRTPGDVSVGVDYSGAALEPATRYDWSVAVWDQTGACVSETSWFETGLMGTGLSARNGAQWIGGGPEDLVLYSHAISVFKLQYTLQLDAASGSTRAGFVYGANDARLMDRNRNIYNIEGGEDECFIRLELDISGVDGTDKGPARLNIYRAGYHPEDNANTPLKSFSIPLSVIHNGNKFESHTVFVESVFGTTRIFVDERDEDHDITKSDSAGQGPFSTAGFNLNPVGSGGDYIAFPLLADIGFSAPSGQKACFSNIRVNHYRSPSNVLFEAGGNGAAFRKNAEEDIFLAVAKKTGADLSLTEGGYGVDGGARGIFVAADPSRNAMPMLRTAFAVEEKKIDRARLYVTARGIYEFYINGNRVGEDWFNPGLTQYNITHMYQTYDVTELIRAGEENAMGAMLGEGWWSGNITFSGSNWNYFGDRQSLLARLVVTYRDGTTEVVDTNDREWKYCNRGPVVYGSFFQGEVYDATREAAVEGWNEPGFDDSGWKPAEAVPLEGAAFSGTSTSLDGTVSDFNYDRFSLVGQIGPNVRVVEALTAKSVEEVRPGVYVYDMGQNMVGVPRIRIDGGAPGQRVTLRYAEVLYPDLPEYGENVGMIMLENIRAALARDIYIFKGGEEVIQPRFTFHGYRYVEITGVDTPPPPEDVQGLVISSVDGLSADYRTSNPKVNRLWENIVWSLRGNFLSIPTDCPQRNERMGWSGDLSVFSRTATYLADADQFLARHMTAMRDLQGDNGKFSGVAPIGPGFGGILWGSAGITVAWEAYQQYGDVQLLRDHYDAMKRYMAYLEGRIDAGTGVVNDGPLGDWLSPEGNRNDNSLLWCAYYVYDLDIMARVAEILGNAEDAERFRGEYKVRKRHFNDTYVDAETGKTVKSDFKSSFALPGGASTIHASVEKTSDGREIVDTQASYAVPLALGVFDDENISRAARRLAETCRRENVDDGGVARPEFSLMTGFIGTAWISKALSDGGFSDIAYRLLQQESYPSWLYPVNQGATTIWERLNSYTLEDGFGGNNSMNSFNHYSFGAVGQWMVAYSLGIQRDENSPGFKHFILKPEIDTTGQMTRAEGFCESMYGRIESAWKVEEGTLIYRATVPANTTATLYLPTSGTDVTENGTPAAEADGVAFLGREGDMALFELGSGSYEFHTGYD